MNIVWVHHSFILLHLSPRIMGDQKEKDWLQAQYDSRSQKQTESDVQQQKAKQQSADYQRVINLATGHFYRQLAAQLGPKPLTIVDLGCGQGADVHKMTNLAHLSRYYGYDLSSKAIDAYTERIKKHGRSDVQYRLKAVDLTSDPLPIFPPGSVDMVICKNALHYFYRPELWNWIHHILAPGGVFGILCLNGQALQTRVLDVVDSKERCDSLPPWISFEREVSVREFLPILESETQWDMNLITQFFPYLDLPIEPSYRFTLAGLVSNVRERLLFPLEMQKQANRSGLHLDFTRDAWTLYEDSQRTETVDGLRGPVRSQLTSGDIFVSGLYHFYSFRKFVS